MRYILSAFLLLTGLSVNSQTILTIEGQTYTNSDETWVGVNIPRALPTALTFRNNSITSVNIGGYMLVAGDEVGSEYNNNLNGALITGNKFAWSGTDMTSITHGLFTGHNIDVIIKYNYLDHVPMGIIRKSATNLSNTFGGVAYNIVKSPNVGIVVKGMSGVCIYNNTLYQDRKTTETGRGLIDLYSNSDVSPKSVSHGTKIYNNIFYTKYETFCINVMDQESLTGFESDYNVFYCETGSLKFNAGGSVKTFTEWQALGYDIHSVVINPDFKDLINFVPAARLDYGKDLGSEWKNGLAVNAKWGASDPETTTQNGIWQIGAIVYGATVGVPAPTPVYSGSSIANNAPAILEITYNMTLTNIVPAASVFSVTVNSAARPVSLVTISGTKVILTLTSPVVFGDVVTVAYTKPASNPLQTADGGQAASFTPQTVINNLAQPANQPPVVNIASPTKSTSFIAPATITIDATAYDTDGIITKVEFFNGTDKLGEKSSAPFSFTWKEVPEGTYLLTVMATDNLNLQAVSNPVTAIVEKAAPVVNQLPVVNITSPQNESLFEAPATITLTAEASDPDGIVSKVEYFDGSIKIGESFSAPFEISLECLQAGTYNIKAVVTDNLNSASVSAEVKICVTLKSNYPDIINLYPNPNLGQFSIDISSPLPDADNNVTVTNLLGNIVYFGTIEEQERTMQFDLSHTPTGKYILIITSGNKIASTKKFIKN